MKKLKFQDFKGGYSFLFFIEEAFFGEKIEISRFKGDRFFFILHSGSFVLAKNIETGGF